METEVSRFTARTLKHVQTPWPWRSHSCKLVHWWKPQDDVERCTNSIKLMYRRVSDVRTSSCDCKRVEWGPFGPCLRLFYKMVSASISPFKRFFQTSGFNTRVMLQLWTYIQLFKEKQNFFSGFFHCYYY